MENNEVLTGATAATESRLLDFLENPFMTLVNDLLGLVPLALGDR